MASGVGDHSGHLGRWYMAHPQGSIANVRFTTPPADTIYGHEQDADGVYVRRRFTFSRSFQLEQGLPNFAGWLVNPELADPRHSNGSCRWSTWPWRPPREPCSRRGRSG